MATLVRWEPFRELAALQSEMSRFMNGLLEGNGQSAQSWVPTADVWETEKDVTADFNNGVLEVHVAKPEQPKPQKIQIGVGGASPAIEGTSKRKES